MNESIQSSHEVPQLLALHHRHEQEGACFGHVLGRECVISYTTPLEEARKAAMQVGLWDLSFRHRITLRGSDRLRFLHGQVTNQVTGLPLDQGCYAYVSSAKGRVDCDLHLWNLPDLLWCDVEPGHAQAFCDRLDKFLIADDVEIADVSEQWAHFHLAGPLAAEVLAQVFHEVPLPEVEYQRLPLPAGWIAKISRSGLSGFDLVAPASTAESLWDELLQVVKGRTGSPAGWDAFEMLRVLHAIPRFPADMNSNHLVSEVAWDQRGISYQKGCYIGQEILNRVRTLGEAPKTLRLLQVITDDGLPTAGSPWHQGDKEVGRWTSLVQLGVKGPLYGLGYVRKEWLSEERFESQGPDGTRSKEVRLIRIPPGSNFFRNEETGRQGTA